MVRTVFLVFEGGGAKGAFHASTLRSVEQNGNLLKVGGFAGTSAGAIMASLAAVGFRADDLLRLEFREGAEGRETVHLCSELLSHEIDGSRADRPTDFLSWGSWQQIRILRTVFSNGERVGLVMLVAALGLVAPLVLTGYERFVADAAPVQGPWAAAAWALYLAVSLLLLALGFYLYVRCGFASLRRLRKALDILYASRVRLAPGEPMTFGALRQRNILLKIVATNLSTGRMKVFSSAEPGDDDVSVAEAVVASAAIPVLFKPVRIGAERFCDGGLVSNLPVWVFGDEQQKTPGSWVIASNLVDPKKDAPAAARPPFFPIAVARAAVFGSDLLSRRGIDPLLRIELAPRIGLLAFDYHRQADLMKQELARLDASAGKQIKELIATELQRATVSPRM